MPHHPVVRQHSRHLRQKPLVPEDLVLEENLLDHLLRAPHRQRAV
jgi:hypothetical protein